MKDFQIDFDLLFINFFFYCVVGKKIAVTKNFSDEIV